MGQLIINRTVTETAVYNNVPDELLAAFKDDPNGEVTQLLSDAELLQEDSCEVESESINWVDVKLAES